MQGLYKTLLYIFNVAFIAVGLTLLAIGIWTAAVKIYVSQVIGDSLFSAISFMFIIVGTIIVTVCIIGICVLAKENSKGLIGYLVCLIICFLILIAAAIMAIVFKTEAEDVMAGKMRQSLISKYGSDKDVTDAWDQLQKDLRCCSVSSVAVTGFSNPTQYPDGTMPSTKEQQLRDSWPLYKYTNFYKQQLQLSEQSRKFVPVSCCRRDDRLNGYVDTDVCQYFSLGPPTNYDQGHNNDYLNYDGCYEKAKDLVLSQSDIILGMGFAFGLVMISGMALTFLFVRQLDEETDRRRGPARNI